LEPSFHGELSRWHPGGAFSTWTQQNGGLKCATKSGVLS